MTDEKKVIKKTMDDITVPNQKLENILERTFKKNVGQRYKKRRRTTRYIATAALAILLLSGTVAFNPVMANVLGQIPIIGNVFSYISSATKPEYNKFSQLATPISHTEESNGVIITTDQGVFDGTTITLSVSIQTKENLGDSPMFDSIPTIKDIPLSNGGYNLEKVEGFGYAGIIQLKPQFDESIPENLTVIWNPVAIEGATSERIEGDWNFNFNLEKAQENIQLINKLVSNEGITIHVKETRQTDLTLNIFYQQLVDPNLLNEWTAVEAEMTASDNLGNVYEVPYNGGFADADAQTPEDLQWSATIKDLDPNATKIILHPFATISRLDKEPTSKIVVFDEIEIEL